jgi:hypothetical protein
MTSINSNIINCVGCDAVETVQQLLLSFGDLATATIASYSHLPIIQERIEPSEAETKIIQEALKLRQSIHLPFWDCVMLAISKSADPMDTLLDTASTHASLRETDIQLNRDSIAGGSIGSHIKENSKKLRETCIVSEVIMSDGSLRHIPMMDFHSAPTKEGRIAATAVCKQIFPNGALLLESGESFHAYGLELMTTSDFFKFLGHSLLYTPIIDRAYIAHQLIEKRCALRVSGASKPIPITLQVV